MQLRPIHILILAAALLPSCSSFDDGYVTLEVEVEVGGSVVLEGSKRVNENILIAAIWIVMNDAPLYAPADAPELPDVDEHELAGDIVVRLKDGFLDREAHVSSVKLARNGAGNWIFAAGELARCQAAGTRTFRSDIGRD